MTRFDSIDPDTGRVTHLGEIAQNDMRKCPHFIMAFEHYRSDGTCRCNDPDHSEMEEWGYKWDASLGRWI